MAYEANFEHIHDYIKELPVHSDHEHHQTDAFFAEGMTLDKAMAASYVAWTGFVPDGSEESRRKVLDHARFNSYFKWFERGVQHLHLVDDPITLDNWESISALVKQAHEADGDFHWKALRDHGYERLILDTYWSPGEDNGHPEIFSPTYRIDKWMYAFHQESADPDGFCPWERYGIKAASLDEVVEQMRATIREAREKHGAVALKCAEAYHRSIAFLPDDKAAAEKAFGKHPDEITEDERTLFGNHIFNRCCEVAAELDIPFQVHTGLAQIAGSQPMNLEPVIAQYPDTRFVLFHSGFPWTHQVTGLAHNYGNVLPSLTWTATICTSAAVRVLHDYIDAACSINSITWGSDCWVPEESLGAMLAWRWIVATVLAERMTDRRLSAADAQLLARKLMHGNNRYIYHGKDPEV